MNVIKKALLGALLMLSGMLTVHAAVPCGSSGTLNVGILADNNPYSSFDAVNGPYGFDVDLVAAIAKVLGLKVNFVFVADQPTAEADLLAGTLDLFANSGTNLTPVTLSNFGAVVTDISQVTNPSPLIPAYEYRGYLFNLSCCTLMYQFEAALNTLIANGTYADLLQKQRGDARQTGFVDNLGKFTNTNNFLGILVEPLPFNSSMAGTIPTVCRSSRSSALLPTTNCFGQFILFNTPNCFTFTGATGPVSGTGCTSF